MRSEAEKLEKIRGFLEKRGAYFVLAYTERKNRASDELKWTMAWAPSVKSREDCEKLATSYKRLAMHCYQCQKNFVFERRERMSLGKDIPTLEQRLGKRLWYLVAAGGPIRKAGCVIIAGIAALEANEVRTLSREMQIIFLDAGRIWRSAIFLGSLIRSKGKNEVNAADKIPRQL